jgi:hypothetical protein
MRRTNDTFEAVAATAVCNSVVEPGEGVAFVYLMMASPSVHVVSDLILYLLSRVSRVFDAFYQARGTMGNVSLQTINATYIHDVYLISLVIGWDAFVDLESMRLKCTRPSQWRSPTMMGHWGYKWACGSSIKSIDNGYRTFIALAQPADQPTRRESFIAHGVGEAVTEFCYI